MPHDYEHVAVFILMCYIQLKCKGTVSMCIYTGLSHCINYSIAYEYVVHYLNCNSMYVKLSNQK